MNDFKSPDRDPNQDFFQERSIGVDTSLPARQNGLTPRTTLVAVSNATAYKVRAEIIGCERCSDGAEFPLPSVARTFAIVDSKPSKSRLYMY